MYFTEMIFIFFLLFFRLSSYANSLRYDQRQTGDLNVQVDLKNIEIFGILKDDKEEYVNYDYTYDYSELTIKPQNRTTPKPLNVTSTSAVSDHSALSDNSTIVNTVQQEYTVSPIKDEITTLEFIATTIIPAKDTSKTNVSDIPIETVSTESTMSVRNSTPKICRKGYVLNQKGDCQLKLHTTGNALLRLVKLSQKLKRRENKSNENL